MKDQINAINILHTSAVYIHVHVHSKYENYQIIM